MKTNDVYRRLYFTLRDVTTVKRKEMIETERLVLRPCRIDDAEFIFTLFNQSECIEFIGDKSMTDLTIAKRYIEEKICSSYAEFGFGMYVVTLKPIGQAIGICGLVKRPHLPVPDLGFAQLSDFNGCGYATEAARGVLRYCDEHLNTKMLFAITKPHNARSIDLLKSLGFQPTLLPDATSEKEKLIGFKLFINTVP